MKEMTKEKFMNSKISDFFEFDEDILGQVIYSKKVDGNTVEIEMDILGVKIIHERPPITRKNLGLFMYLNDGEYPKAKFWDNEESNSVEEILIEADRESSFIYRGSSSIWNHCEITDPRWTFEAMEGAER